MRRIALLAPLAIAAVIAGCGSSSSSSSTAAPASTSSSGSAAASSGGGGGGQLTLSESEFKITPANAHVSSTGTISITVKNAGAVTHALSVQTPSGTVSTSNIAPGATATLKVNATKGGKYTFYCPIPGHRQAGMQGVLVVGSASASSGGSSGAAATTSKSNNPY
jgi:uncharacterized cupredoxin-like copper-binding protein